MVACIDFFEMSEICLPKFIVRHSTYSKWQKYGINSLRIKQIFFQKNLWTGHFFMSTFTRATNAGVISVAVVKK
jgi:hypothetical protein